LKSRPVRRTVFLAEHSDFNTFYKIWITRIDANEAEPQPLCSRPSSADHGRCSGDRNGIQTPVCEQHFFIRMIWIANTRRLLKMRVRFFACLLLVLIATVVFPAAQEPVKPALSPRIITATKQVSIFTGLENQLLQAVQKKDKAAAQAMLTDDLYIEMPDADPLPGDDWLDSVMAKDYTLKSFVVRQMSAIDMGNAVVVKFDRLQEAVSKGKPDSGEFFVVDVWKKDGENWKLASRYVSKVSSVPYMPKADVKPTGKK
jgi:hypothetical protein